MIKANPEVVANDFGVRFVLRGMGGRTKSACVSGKFTPKTGCLAGEKITFVTT